MTSHWR